MRAIIALALLVPIMAACGGTAAQEAGGGGGGAEPQVVGMNLVTAEKLLQDNDYAYTEVAQDGVFGIVNPNHWTVCKQTDVADHLVELQAAKRGCQP